MAAGAAVGNCGGGVAQKASIISSRFISDTPPSEDGSGEGNQITTGQGHGDCFRLLDAQLANAGARIINNSWGGLYWNDPALTIELAAAWKDFVVGPRRHRRVCRRQSGRRCRLAPESPGPRRIAESGPRQRTGKGLADRGGAQSGQSRPAHLGIRSSAASTAWPRRAR